MNFGFLVAPIQAAGAFDAAVGVMLLTTLGQLYFFRRRGLI